MFVTKGTNHRGIRLSSVEEIIRGEMKNNTFIEEFLDNPLLIDGYKWEFGVYTYITSISPLRIYVYEDIQVVLVPCY